MLFPLSAVAVVALSTLTSALPGKPKPHEPSTRTKCPIIFDGRLSAKAQRTDFDDPAVSPFNVKNVKGENLTWSSIIQLPPFPVSLYTSPFDIPLKHRPFEVTISDASLFRAGGNLQTGFRRAGLLFKNDTNPEGSDQADKGVATFHWSVLQDLTRPLNLTHEYMNVWHERADYAGNQFSFSMGLLLEVDGGDGINTRKKREALRVQDRQNKIIFETPIRWVEWQNFAIQLDYEASTIQVFYSKGSDKLKAVTKKLPNDNSGGGQMQLGMAKKPTETETVVFDGYQEHIKRPEGQIYSGVFVEDSTSGCISV